MRKKVKTRICRYKNRLKEEMNVRKSYVCSELGKMIFLTNVFQIMKVLIWLAILLTLIRTIYVFDITKLVNVNISKADYQHFVIEYVSMYSVVCLLCSLSAALCQQSWKKFKSIMNFLLFGGINMFFIAVTVFETDWSLLWIGLLFLSYVLIQLVCNRCRGKVVKIYQEKISSEATKKWREKGLDIYSSPYIHSMTFPYLLGGEIERVGTFKMLGGKASALQRPTMEKNSSES